MRGRVTATNRSQLFYQLCPFDSPCAQFVVIYYAVDSCEGAAHVLVASSSA